MKESSTRAHEPVARKQDQALHSEQAVAHWDVEALTEYWAGLTSAESNVILKIPLGALREEALALAAVVEANLEARKVGEVSVPGLGSVGSAVKLTDNTPRELRELALVVGAVHSRRLAEREITNETEVIEAQRLLRELRALLVFVLEDGEHSEGEAQLRSLRRDFSQDRSHDGKAMELEAYATLADLHSHEFAHVPTYEPALISQALSAAQALRQRSATRIAGEYTTSQRELLRLRNRLAQGLLGRMRNIRRVVRFVMRDHPEIIRQAQSTYERKLRRRGKERVV